MATPPKDTITLKHVKKAAEIWRAEPRWGGFRDSTTYDVKIGRGRYPPKAICAIANYLATRNVLRPGDFPGAFDGPWHRVLTDLKLKIVAKRGKTEARSSNGDLLDAGVGTGEDDEDFPEGGAVYQMHRSKERSRRLIKRAKAIRLKATGKLACEVCSFDFAAKYGSAGAGYIEGHHTLPMSTLTAKTRTKISDIALVCANCHRMLHLMKPIRSVPALRAHLADFERARL